MSDPAADSPQAPPADFHPKDFCEAYSLIFGVELAYGENVKQHCICHPDEEGSCSVNTAKGVWECHAIDGSGGGLIDAIEVRYGVSRQQARKIAKGWGLLDRRGTRTVASTDKPDTEPLPLPDGEALAEVYAQTLREPKNAAALTYLTERLHFTDESLTRFQVGFWERNQAYTFPVRNREGLVVNIKKYYPFRDPDDKTKVKSDGCAGHNGKYLWPIDALNGDDKIVIVEGEKDCITISQHLPEGYRAVTATTGAKNFPVYLAELFAGKDVVAVFDCDAAGRAGADKVVASLAPYANSVKSVDLGLGEHEDVWDYFDGGGTWSGLQTLINKSNVVAALPAIQLAPPATRGWLGDCLDDKGGIIPAAFGQKFLREFPMAMGGGVLYRYDADRGVYVDDGEDWTHKKIVQLLGQLWKVRVHGELVRYITICATDQKLWDPPPRHLVNCRNGILDVNRMELRDHTPEHLSPVQIPVMYDPDARCPAIEKFATTAMQPGDDQVFYEIAGLLLVPVNELHRMFMLVGQGGTGKSTALKLLVALIGERNRSTLPLHAIADDRFATADLLGRLANVCADIDSSDLRQTGVLKQITGGDAIRAQHKNKPSFVFTPFARLLFSANDPPQTSEASQAFYRRFLILPFTHKFTKPDRNIDRRLQKASELSGLLNHALAGLERLNTQGEFTVTDSTENAKQQFRTETSTVASFVDECIEIKDGEKVSKKNLFQFFRVWAKESNQGLRINKRTFNKQLVEVIPGLTEYPVNGYPHWKGVAYNGPKELSDDVPF